MKKLISVLLATLLVLSLGGTALAAGVDAVDKIEVGQSNGATYGEWDGTVADATKDDMFIYDNTKGQATQNTDIWVRSKAAGQIDATVPLLVVVSTDIDGLSTQTPTNYAIRNYSTVGLQLEDITITPQSGWTLLGKGADATRDEMNAGATASNNNIAVTVAGVHAATDVTVATSIAQTTNFDIAANAAGTAGTETNLGLSVATSKLNFVTYDGATPDNGDVNKGVFAVKITYTLALDQAFSGATIDDNAVKATP